MGDRTVELGRPAGVVNMLVVHACGHTVRWTFYGGPTRARVNGDLAALAACARCDSGRFVLDEDGIPITQLDIIPDGGCDISWPATGICHAHDGPCPDSLHDRFLHHRTGA